MSDETYTKKDLLPGIFFAGFMAAAFAAGVYYLPESLKNVETPASADILRGKWEPKFEKALGDALPVGAASRDFWGRAEYMAFGQGRKGVVVGSDGWLYTAEEFSCPADYAASLQDNLSYISKTAAVLASRNVRVAIALVPAKSRVLPEHLGANRLPACRMGLYDAVRQYLHQHDIPVTDMLATMNGRPTQDDLYLKTDTHWSPAGAQIGAAAIGDLVHASYPGLSLPQDRFTSVPAAPRTRDGDLARYLPGVGIEPEKFAAFATSEGVSVAGAGSMQGLLGDAPAPLVTLVGTSYSANPDWNFEGFLKEALKADVLNMAEEGQGPFVVMDKYLQNKVATDNPPRLLVWEIPERYLVMPHGVAP